MKNSVVVTANPANGQVFTSSGVSEKDGKEYGFIRVESTEIDFSGPVAQKKTRSALKAMSRETFDAAELAAGSVIPGHIVVKESTTKNPNRTNQLPKTQGKDGGVLLLNGLPIYRETEFTTDLSVKDEMLKHTSVGAPIAVASAQPLNS